MFDIKRQLKTNPAGQPGGRPSAQRGARRASRVVAALLMLSAAVLATGCASLDQLDPPAPPTATPAERLAVLTIRPDAGPTPPADIDTAFAIQGDPTYDIPIGSAGCTVRQLVLMTSVEHAHGTTGGRCGTPLAGDWTPLFGGPTVHDPAALDIGYVIPLTDAWRSGAATWNDPDRLNQFALDESWERVVIVTGSDAARAGRTPDAWQPDPADQCTYASTWINAKWAWQLSITRAEHQALAAMLTTCPSPATVPTSSSTPAPGEG
jgi:hypothetical protein